MGLFEVISARSTRLGHMARPWATEEQRGKALLRGRDNGTWISFLLLLGIFLVFHNYMLSFYKGGGYLSWRMMKTLEEKEDITP